jgi:hypothetical protein
MRIRNFVIAAFVLALAIPGFASAGSANDRATGGGQIFFTFENEDGEPSANEDIVGAGDTIAFTAQEGQGGVKGQVQFIDRTGGTGQGQVKLHGTVTCLEVEGNTARIGGTAVRNDDESRGSEFQILVVDNGEGAANLEGDQIAFQFVDSPDCQEQDGEDDYQTTLARGNVQVYDAPDE